MRNSVLVFLLLLISPFAARAQAEDNIWAFGYNAALDLNSGSPSSLSGFMTSVSEGTASISDSDGDLLFYSAGQQAWNKDHDLMPNGTGILGHDGSGTQSTAICKYPGSDSLYYLFTLENYENITAMATTIGYLRYNIIDMSLDGGLGDVITTEKNVVLDSFMGEKMVVINDDGCGYWLVTYNWETSAYHSYRITEEGIEPPVISSGASACGIVGEIKISPDGSKIANAAYIEGDVEVASFDISTGAVSDFILLSHMSPYGAGFSPNSQVLYINNGQLYQYDLSGFPDEDEVAASEYTYSSWVSLSAFRLATNGKLYFPSTSTADIHAINEPDELGAASDLETSAYTLSSGSAVFGLGAQIPVNLNIGTGGQTVSVETYAPGLAATGEASCIRGCAPAWFRISRAEDDMEEDYTVSYSIEGTGVNGTDYEWIPDQVTIPAGSSYADIYIRPQVLPDLKVLRTVSLKILDTVGCSNNPIPVTILSDKILILDSIYVSVVPGDTSICKGETVMLKAETNYEDYLIWSPDAALDPSPDVPVVYVRPDASVSYTATINVPWSGCDVEEDISVISISNETMVVNLDYTAYSDPICIYDTITLKANGGYSYTYFNRFNDVLGSDSVLDVIVPDRYYEYIVLALDERGCLDSAVVSVQAEPCCEVLIPNAFSPNGDGVNDRFGVVTDGHPEEFRLEIFNRWGERVFISYKPEDTWDGTYEEGTPADAGVYFYTVKGLCYGGDLFRKRGDLTLVR
ncbi:MAG: gliding motility-associated C-terminal domain-containing protein [Taibaiella sp.]|nr:gliding motility-associated C-terminal domain-containing protein [Taibaiella sp.]